MAWWCLCTGGWWSGGGVCVQVAGGRVVVAVWVFGGGCVGGWVYEWVDEWGLKRLETLG